MNEMNQELKEILELIDQNRKQLEKALKDAQKRNKERQNQGSLGSSFTNSGSMA